MLTRSPATYAALVGLFVAGAITAIALAFGGESFRESFLSGVSATVAGLAIGVPTGLWVGLRLLQTEASEARAAERSRRAAVLNSIAEELDENLADLELVVGRGDDEPRPIIVPPLRDDVWRAMSRSGQIAGLDPTLIAELSETYAFLRTTRELEDRIVRISDAPPWPAGGRAAVTRGIQNDLAEIDPSTTDLLRKAVGLVRAALEAQATGRSSGAGGGGEVHVVATMPPRHDDASSGGRATGT